MAERLVVLIENDPVLSERLRAVLAAYHLRVELIHDGNDLTARRDLAPSLIILCIDPKRLGWAVCNKIKKAPQYLGVPMIVTSQEATEKDFEDHKKLKTRAEEYLHKPFGVELLLEKVASLIGLDPPQLDNDEAIPIDDASLIEAEEDLPAAPVQAAAPGPIQVQSPEKTVYDPGAAAHLIGPYIDQQIAEETDAAFAAIGVGLDGGGTGRRPSLPGVSPRAATPPQADHDEAVELDADELEMGFEEVVTTGVRKDAVIRTLSQVKDAEGTRAQEEQARLSKALREAQEQAAEAQRQAAEAQRQAAEAQRQAADARAEAERWHDERDHLASERDRLSAERKRLSAERDSAVAERDSLLAQRPDPSQTTQGGQDQEETDRRLRELEAERDLLQRERDRLQKELDEGRSRGSNPPGSPSATTFSREREFLNLREIINKKDKEILDLRDALDSKERQILDARDKGRELERTRRDLDERLLEVEKELVSARERLEALAHDKERGLEREKGLKARLDDAQRKLLKADEEIDAWKKRHGADMARAEEALAAARAEAQQAQQVLRAEHEAALQRERSERAAEVTALTEANSRALAEARAQLEAARVEAEVRHAQTVATMNEGREAALLEVAQRHEAALQAEREAHAERLAELERARRAEAEEAERRRLEEVGRAEEAGRAALLAAEERRQGDLAALQQAHLAEAAQRRQEHEGLLATQAEAHAREKDGLMQEHRRQMDELTAVLTGERDEVAGRLAEREEDLRHSQTRLAESEAQVASLRQRLAEMVAQLEAAQGRITEKDGQLAQLERENTGFQEQILRAYQRIKGDEALVSRAKKAMAIALTLLDECGAPLAAAKDDRRDEKERVASEAT
jgi:chromosome segregation ATPase